MPNVTPEEFVQIYREFGYHEALYRDPASLSYVAVLQPGLWLLALDSCLYRENVEGEEPVTDGRFCPTTLQWIEDMLEKAARESKAVIAMLHHGIVEHYKGQEKNYGEYVVDDFHAVSRLLAMYNVRLVLARHYHAQGITVVRWGKDNKFLFDIETGSLVTYPCTYRVVSVNAFQEATVQTRRIQSIRSHPADFQEYARRYLLEGIAGIASRTIQEYGVAAAEADKLGRQVAPAFVAHYAGDEKLTAGQEAIQTKGLSLRGWLVVTYRRDLVHGLWQDLEPPDNNVDLAAGEWR